MNRFTKVIIAVILSPFILIAYISAIYNLLKFLLPALPNEETALIILVLLMLTGGLIAIAFNCRKVLDDTIEIPKEARK